jgi:hypothetical protein
MSRRAARRVLYAAGLAALAVAPLAGANDGTPPKSNHSVAAVLVAGLVLCVASLLAFAVGKKRAIALVAVTVQENGTDRKIPAGSVIPDPVRSQVPAEKYKPQRGRYFRALVVGADNRWSTSKFQAVLWTYAILWGLIALMLAKGFRNPGGWTALTEMPARDWDTYLILLGGPFAAAVLAKYITAEKVDNGTVQKTVAPAEGPSVLGGLGEVVSDDAGRADLVDSQYLAFTLVALSYFLVTLWWNLSKGFPNLPDILVGLTSVSAASYVAKKAADRATPSLTSLVPSKVRPGAKIEVWGRNLVVEPPTTPAPAGWGPRATVDGLEATTKVVADGGPADRLKVTVPPSVNGEVKLSVITAVGTSAGTLDLNVDPNLPAPAAMPGAAPGPAVPSSPPTPSSPPSLP